MNTNIVTPSCRLHFYFRPLTPDSKKSQLKGRHHVAKYQEPYLPQVTLRDFQIKKLVQVGQLHLPQGTEKIMGSISEVWLLKTRREFTNPGLRPHCIEIKIAVSFPSSDQNWFDGQTDFFLDFFEYLSIVC